MAHLLGIDASTQSVSALVIDTDGGAIEREASVNFGKRLPQYGAPSGFVAGARPGEVFADPMMWVEALEQLLEELQAAGALKNIAAVCGAAQQHGSVYLNEKWPCALAAIREGRAENLRARLLPCLARARSPIWMDTSTAEECREIAEALGGREKVCALSGSVPVERFTGPQIRRFWKRSPEAYGRTTRIHLVSSFLCSVLCGQDAPIDTGDGAGMNLLNLTTGDWDGALLDAAAPQLREKLPPVVGGGTRAGTLGGYFVKKFGFAPETPVLVFTGDNPSSLVGMGAATPETAVISLGTSDTIFAAMPQGAFDPEGFGHAFGNPLGGQMSLQCFVNGSLAREAVRERIGYDWAAFAQALFRTPAGNDGNRMLPFVRPEISPRIDLNRFVLKGDAEFERWEKPAHAVRACVEGQLLNMKLRSAWMGLRPARIRLTGGAARDDGIAQIVADIFQTKVERLPSGGSVALGATLRAAHHCLGVPLADLESKFCRPAPGSTRTPAVPPGTYDVPLRAFETWIAQYR